VGLFIAFGIIAFIVYKVTTPEERKRHFGRATDALVELKAAARKPRPEYDDFRAALRARMRFPLVTASIVVVISAVFIRMLFGPTAIGNPDTLVAWGASMGTRTTNGEWWRLVTASFLHTGTLHFLVDVAILIQLGLILERLVGRLTLAAVYLSAGVFDTLVNLASRPVEPTVGASGAVFGLYGLLLAALMWQAFHAWRGRREVNTTLDLLGRSDAQGLVADWNGQETVADGDAQPPIAQDVTIPFIAMKRLGIVAALFILYSLFSGHAGAAEFTGLLVGMMYGFVFARRAHETAPGIRGVACAIAATTIVVAVSAVVVGGITDVKPELARVVALEDSTVAAYQSELTGLKKGRVSAEAVAQLVEGTIVPQLQAADARLKSLTNVPPEHRAAVADAREFVRLRCESWLARGKTIRRSYAEQPLRPDGADDTSWRIQLQERFRSDTAARANAEGAERASREALQRVARFLTEHA
jgi:membrane associated rhomboid family serine protease